MAALSPATTYISQMTCDVNFGGSHSRLSHGSLQFWGMSTPIAIRYPACAVGAAGCRRANLRRTSAAAVYIGRSKNGALGQLLVLARKKRGQPRLESSTVSAKDFFQSPLVKSGATAEVQDRFEDSTSDGTATGRDPAGHDQDGKDQGSDLWDRTGEFQDKRTTELKVGNEIDPQRENEVVEGVVEDVADDLQDGSRVKLDSDDDDDYRRVGGAGVSVANASHDDGQARNPKLHGGHGHNDNQVPGQGVQPRTKDDLASWLRGVQIRTSELDLGAEFEAKEQEVARGLRAHQIIKLPEVVQFEEEPVDDISVPRENWIEEDEKELIALSSGFLDLAVEEEKLVAEQKLQILLAVKDTPKPETRVSAEEVGKLPEDPGTETVDVGGAIPSKAYEKELVELASKNSFLNRKMFFYPEAAVAPGKLEVFLNRKSTPLERQPVIFMKGSFNDWRWKPFLVELKKSEVVPGDWWHCKLDLPKESYRVDFIFFDGKSTYENNSGNDFFILVRGGMTKEHFQHYLQQEMARDAQKLAEEKARKASIVTQERRQAEHTAAEEVDRAEARRVVSEKMESARKSMAKAVRSVHGLWYFEPSEFGGGDRVRLYYNRSSRPLGYTREVWIHGGKNNWEDMVSIVGKLKPEQRKDGDWWSVEVKIPEKAYMINWVFADGPPDAARHYDNNGSHDFHTIASKSLPDSNYWAKLEEEIYQSRRQKTLAREDEAYKKVEYRSRMKKALKARTMQTIAKAQSHIFYTDPVEVRAGEEITIFYNPSNTVLNGKPEVYIRGSFNRWTYKDGHFPTTKLSKVENSSHLMTKVKVPQDAYVVDFVFSEKRDEKGGVYDNKNGLDYHIHVSGSSLRQPPLDIVHIALEMAPVAKVGGLGDVVTSLSRAIEEQGHSAQVILPKYDCMEYKYIEDLREVSAYHFGGTKLKVWYGKVEGLNVHFLEPENGMFWVGCVYGRGDDGNRFGFFCHAALEYLLQSGRQPDILHCHDWSSAPITWLFQEYYKHDNLQNARTIFTIHNHEFGVSHIEKAMVNAHMATTVSPTYAREMASNPAISPHAHKFYGILNGIDPDIWDPCLDPFIPVSFDVETVKAGKKSAKEVLQDKLGLRQVDCPMVGIVTRLTAQKGINLIKHGLWRTLERGGQVVLLGSAPDPRIQNEFVGLANQLNQLHGDMARLCLYYDEPLSHMIYAGADFMLIPSIFEPCGLTQLTAMRYGTIPVVRQTGGLYDTVFDVDHDQHRAREHGVEANGWTFASTDTTGLDYALNRAITAWYEARPWFDELRRKVMEQDWSWNRPALDYNELYNGAKKL